MFQCKKKSLIQWNRSEKTHILASFSEKKEKNDKRADHSRTSWAALYVFLWYVSAWSQHTVSFPLYTPKPVVCVCVCVASKKIPQSSRYDASFDYHHPARGGSFREKPKQDNKT